MDNEKNVKKDGPGMLYLCATPIGNLEDITYRVLRVLSEADLIAAEDTRNSIKLLNHFEIKTPMTSYHEFNKYDKAKVLVDKILGGMDVAVITDAGTPGISDPGEELVKQCRAAGIRVTSLPGPAACITALTMRRGRIFSVPTTWDLPSALPEQAVTTESSSGRYSCRWISQLRCTGGRNLTPIKSERSQTPPPPCTGSIQSPSRGKTFPATGWMKADLQCWMPSLHIWSRND